MLQPCEDIRYNQFTMLSALSVVLNKECRLKQSQVTLVGFSGGPDSTMLVHAMHVLGYPMIAAHLDHGLRPTSAGEAIALQHMLSGWKIPFISTCRDVKTFAAERGYSIEEAARVVRYEFLFELARLHQTQAVVVGHQADDQVETVLMHLLRGSGLAGLCGMPFHSLPNPWSTTIPLVRPLLKTWRDEILTYCSENDLHPLEDQSNRDTSYYRNRLRHELIPYLEGNYNSNLRRLLLRMADNLSHDHRMISSIVEETWRKCLLEENPAYVGFSYDQWASQSLAIQRHLLRKAMYNLLPDLRDVDYETVARALAFIEEIASQQVIKPTKQVELTGGLRLVYEKRGKRLWIVNPWQMDRSGDGSSLEIAIGDLPQIPAKGEIELEIPGEIKEAGWACKAEWVDGEHAKNSAASNRDPWQAWFDLSRLTPDLERCTLRPRHAGERFQPLGMDGKTVKITDMMINLKIPHAARARYPILSVNDIPIWLPGYRTAQSVRIDHTTRRALYVYFNPSFKPDPSK